MKDPDLGPFVHGVGVWGKNKAESLVTRNEYFCLCVSAIIWIATWCSGTHWHHQGQGYGHSQIGHVQSVEAVSNQWLSVRAVDQSA